MMITAVHCLQQQPTLDWRMLPSLDALKKSQQKQVQTTMRSSVLRQGLEVNMAIVDPRPGTETVIFIVFDKISLFYPHYHHYYLCKIIIV